MDVESDFYIDAPDNELDEFEARILTRKYVEIWGSEDLQDR